MGKAKVETIDMFGPETVINQAKRDTLAQARKEGCECPVCGQFVKVYRRTINSTMARQLLTAYHKHGAGVWFHTRDVVLIDSSGAGDFAKLEYWELIDRQHHKPGDENKRSSGMWRITERGKAFIERRQVLVKYAIVYNNRLLDMKGGPLTIDDALGQNFDYREIMGWTPLQAANGAAE